jgi:lipopolysaccharide/colanic/teichoic acid biosynthesis glycosyltransferase
MTVSARSASFQAGYPGKRLSDLLILLLSAPITIPLLIVVAILVRLDSSGPVIFTQQRTGQHGRRFRMYKFRTMVANAEELKASLAHLNMLPWPDFKVPDDPRVTRIGRVLRKTSLDELPQLLNVLRGEMTIVGPRPTSFAPTTYRLWHTERLELTPGITGLWQTKARGSSTFDERLRYDIEYLDRMSPMLDAKIIALTALAVVNRSGH